MSELENLMQTLCPDGVEYKSMQEIVKSISTGLNPRKKQYEYYRDKLLSFDGIKRGGGV